MSKQNKRQSATPGSLHPVVGPPPGMQEDHIRKNGTIDDTYVETWYEPLQAVIPVPDKEYIRLQCDAGGVDSETRIAYITLEALGWRRPNSDVSRESAENGGAHCASIPMLPGPGTTIHGTAHPSIETREGEEIERKTELWDGQVAAQ